MSSDQLNQLASPPMDSRTCSHEKAGVDRRTDLHRVLLEAVAGVASIDTRFGWTAVSADPSGA